MDTESDNFRTEVKFILSGLVIKTYCDLPGMFFGVRLMLKMRLCNWMDDRDLSSVMDMLTLETDLPTFPNLNTTSHSTPPHISSTAVTSTQHKTVSTLSTTFHCISMSIKLVFPHQ